jgi:hypothetical protein
MRRGHLIGEPDSRRAKQITSAGRIAVALLAGLALIVAPPAHSAELELQTVAAFDRYVQLTEKQIDAAPRDGSTFLWLNRLPESRRNAAHAQLRQGQVLIEQVETLDNGQPISIPGGMVHHWIGTIFVPGATLAQTLALLKDYDHQAEYYKPDVMRSRILEHTGDDFRIYLRFYKKKVLTSVLDTQHEVHYTTVDATQAWSRSRSLHIREVENPGKADEKLRPEGDDRGLLWKMYTYWRFEEKGGGTYVECQSVSLTRDIPTGLGWLVGPYVNSVPRESLTFTLTATRAALLRRSPESAAAAR